MVAKSHAARLQWAMDAPPECRGLVDKLNGRVADYMEAKCELEDKGSSRWMQSGWPVVGF